MTTGARVLVVDDEPMIAAWAGRAIGAVGCAIRTLHTGAELRRALSEEPNWPSLIVLDLNLQDAHGMDIYREFRDLPTRWIFLTGNVALPEVRALPDDGPRVVAKPVRAKELRDIAAQVLEASADVFAVAAT